MIGRSDKLPVTRQCERLNLSRSSVYYVPQPVSEGGLALMRRIDELHLNHPFAGARMPRDFLRLEGIQAGRRHVSTLMRKMGIEALCRRPNSSRKHPDNPVFPYLLRGPDITAANQVWAMDITYIPMRKGFVYLAAVLDWATRRVLSWRLSNSMAADFCVEAVEEAIQRHGVPGIFNKGSRQPIHQPGVRRPGPRPWHPSQHGRQGPMGRQCVRRTALEKREIRGGLLARLRLGVAGEGRLATLFHILQRTAAAFFA
jgi:putative transposase